MTTAPALAAAAGDVLSVLDAARLPACLIGGLAVQRWGHMRATADVDLAVLTGYGNEAPTLDTLLDHFEPRHADARAFALMHRVLLLRTARPQDLVDVAGVVQRQGAELDVDLIRRWGREFAELKEEPDLLRPFEEALRTINR